MKNIDSSPWVVNRGRLIKIESSLPAVDPARAAIPSGIIIDEPAGKQAYPRRVSGLRIRGDRRSSLITD